MPEPVSSKNRNFRRAFPIDDLWKSWLKIVIFSIFGIAGGASCRSALLAEIFGSASAPDPSTDVKTLTVFAAASLVDAFTVMEENFETENPGVDVIINFAGSQRLSLQLLQGAPADVYASADLIQMEAVVQSGRIGKNDVRVFAQNRLVVIQPVDNPSPIESLRDLARPGLRLVIAADEEPVGWYTGAFLDKASQIDVFGESFKIAVLRNVVSYEENVRVVLGKVSLGEADAGVVYASDIGASAASRLKILDIPEELNVSAEYPIASLRDSAQPEIAARFIEMVFSDYGQAVLAENGFAPIVEQ